MIERVLRSPEMMDQVRFEQLKATAKSTIARLEAVVGDGATIHDARVHISKIRSRIQILERDGECIYRRKHIDGRSGGCVERASLSTLVVLEQCIESGRRYASLHGA